MNYLKPLEFSTSLIIYAKQELSENEICLERDESGNDQETAAVWFPVSISKTEVFRNQCFFSNKNFSYFPSKEVLFLCWGGSSNYMISLDFQKNRKKIVVYFL